MQATEIKSRPILFSGDMVRAILDGRKTQTRIIVKPQPHPDTEAMRDIPRTNRWWAGYEHADTEHGVEYRPLGSDQQYEWHCPYGVPGDRLWVREAWQPVRLGFDYCDVQYRADGKGEHRVERYPDYDGRKLAQHYGDKCGWGLSWCTPIHMPRWASRILLEVTGVRVERVQDISEDDAVSEGLPDAQYHPNPFAELWDSINAKRGYGWSDNPWTWVVAFKVIEGGNTDV